MLCYNLVVQLAGGIAIYYFKYVTGNEGLYPIFTTAAQFAEIAALFLFPILSNYFTKKQVFERTGFLRNLKKTLIQEEYKELLDEIEQLPASVLQLVSQELYFVDSLHHRTW